MDESHTGTGTDFWINRELVHIPSASVITYTC
jgi:hypothetical protein